MVTLHNVMPVDLAIKREMEYRHKMEALKNQPLNNLNPLLPSQVRPYEPNFFKFLIVSHLYTKADETVSS